ncbi:MAG TPA: GNAT family N-acetyltransferase [Streptosporangiaceae bacterium]
MPASDVTFRLLDGGQVAAAEDEFVALHHEIYGQAETGVPGTGQFAVRRRQPGFVLAEVRHGGYLVGYSAGMPLRPSTSWWKQLTTALPEQDTAEYPGRTFALTDLAVRAAWRRQGLARVLHDQILTGRPEERATLAVAPDATAAQHAFRSWGWRKVARTRGGGEPVLDLLVRDLSASRRD